MQDEPRITLEQLNKLSLEAQNRFATWFKDHAYDPDERYELALTDEGKILPRFTMGEILICFETLHPVHADLSYLFSISKLPTTQHILNHLWAMLAMEWEQIPQQFIDEVLKKKGKKITFEDFVEEAGKFAKDRGITN